MNRIALLGLITIAFFVDGCVPAQKVGPSSSPVITQSHATPIRPEDRQRLKDISARAPKGKEVFVDQDNLFIVSDAVAEGDNPVLRSEEVEAGLKKYPTYQGIKLRLDYLQEAKQARGSGKSFYDPEIPGHKVIREARSFTFNAVKVLGKDNKPRYYVKSVQYGDYVLGNIEGRLPQPLRRQKLQREDFLNPSDIDWMLGVQDFTKINLADVQN